MRELFFFNRHVHNPTLDEPELQFERPGLFFSNTYFNNLWFMKYIFLKCLAKSFLRRNFTLELGTVAGTKCVSTARTRVEIKFSGHYFTPLHRRIFLIGETLAGVYFSHFNIYSRKTVFFFCYFQNSSKSHTVTVIAAVEVNYIHRHYC